MSFYGVEKDIKVNSWRDVNRRNDKLNFAMRETISDLTVTIDAGMVEDGFGLKIHLDNAVMKYRNYRVSEANDFLKQYVETFEQKLRESGSDIFQIPTRSGTELSDRIKGNMRDISFRYNFSDQALKQLSFFGDGWIVDFSAEPFRKKVEKLVKEAHEATVTAIGKPPVHDHEGNDISHVARTARGNGQTFVGRA